MPLAKMIGYRDASPEARAVFDDNMAICKTDRVGNFRKVPVDPQFRPE